MRVDKLIRVRSANADPELAKLKRSVLAVGLSNPIRIEQIEAGFELIHEYRRRMAFRELSEDTGDPRYTRTVAALGPHGEVLADIYRKMVDETLVRKDLSFEEMAQLDLSYAQDARIEVADAGSLLHASALQQK